MDCKTFRKSHLAYVDDTLPGVELLRMCDHIGMCEGCAAWDHRVRRSLMLVRSHLSHIEISAGFGARLNARLDLERQGPLAQPSGARPFQWGGFAMVGAIVGLAAVAVLVVGLLAESPPQASASSIVRGPSHRVADAPPTLWNATPAFMASVSTGMAILPAIMLAEEVPIRPASLSESIPTFRTAGLTLPAQEQR